MEYLKLFTSFLDNIEPLNDDERGRLFTAMLVYAKDGMEIDLQGNERFVWPVAKQNIDRTAKSYKNKVAGAAKARAYKDPNRLLRLVE